MSTRLEEASQAINQESDRLNALVDDVDKLLKRLNLGVECWVSNPAKQLFLGYARVDGKWGLAVSNGIERWQFRSAPRQLRMEAIASLGFLFDGLAAEARTLTEQIRVANETLTAFVETACK